jgi:sulfonate transport system ATP-binding protein
MLNNSLTLENISKRFASRPGSSTQLQVLDNIHLDIAPGEFISIVGASGCGKSTLLRLILGLDEEYDGRILLDGKPYFRTTACSPGSMWNRTSLSASRIHP